MKQYIYIIMIVVQSCGVIEHDNNSTRILEQTDIFDKNKMLEYQNFIFSDTNESIFINNLDTIRFELLSSKNIDIYKGINTNGRSYNIEIQYFYDSIIKSIDIIERDTIVDSYLIKNYGRDLKNENLFCSLNEIPTFVRPKDKINNDLFVSFLGNICENKIDSILYIHRMNDIINTYYIRFDFFKSGIINSITCLEENNYLFYSKRNSFYSDTLIIWNEILMNNHFEQDVYHYPKNDIDSFVSFEFNDIGIRENVGNDVYKTKLIDDTIKLYKDGKLIALQVELDKMLKIRVYK